MIIGSISSGCAFELLAFFCAKVIIVAIATTECYGTFEEGNHMKLRTSISSLIYTEISGVFPQGFTSQDPSPGKHIPGKQGIYEHGESYACCESVCFPKDHWSFPFFLSHNVCQGHIGRAHRNLHQLGDGSGFPRHLHEVLCFY